ncbi:MAG: glycine/sarcosine/betaine reductase component B subunit [Candidatus Tectomicrobia bacterium]
MRLEMASYHVKDVQWSDRTGFEHGILYVDQEALRRLVMADGDFAGVDIEIVRPGEAVRLIHVIDVVEPRCKAEGGSTFPGLLGPVKTVGEGRTYRLAGMGIVSVSEPVAGEATYWSEAVMDMAGPGAEVSSLGSVMALVLNLTPHSEYLRTDVPEANIQNVMRGSLLAQRYNRQVRVAQLKAAAYLAKAAALTAPEDIKFYELAPPSQRLPRVVYLFQVRPLIYGDSFEKLLPTLLHPNEVMDGALVGIRKGDASSREVTYFYQNPSVITSLYERDGEDLEFVGVVLFPTMTTDMDAKERAAEFTAKLMRMLRIDGVCASSASGGNPWIEFMLCCQKCERAGIKTVLVLPESVGAPDDSGFVHYVPEAVSIVSSGRTTQSIALPAMERVIGGSHFFHLDASPAGELDIPIQYLLGCTTNLGHGRLAGKEY